MKNKMENWEEREKRKKGKENALKDNKYYSSRIFFNNYIFKIFFK